MEETKFKFPKESKLKSRIDIQNLFESGQSIQENNIKILFLQNNKPNNQIAFTVPKRNFKLAVDRNLLKRRMRESYRLNQLSLNNITNKYDIIFIYLGKKTTIYEKINHNVMGILNQLTSLKKT